MNAVFVDILKKLIAEQGKEALLNPAKCKAFLADYTKGGYKKESRLLLQALDVGAHKAIDAAWELEICKKQQVRALHEENFLTEDAAIDVVDTLALVLRGEQGKGASRGAVCANCGKELQKEWTICPYCGKSVAKVQQEPQPSPAPVRQTPPPASANIQTQSAPLPSPTPVTQAPSPPPAAPPKKKHTIRNVVLVILGIFVLLWIIGIASGNLYTEQTSTSGTGSSNTFYERGREYYIKSDYDNAITQYTEAIRIDPNYAWAYSGRGSAYRMKGQYDTAIKDLNEAIRLDPNNALAYSNRGEAYRMKGQYDTAFKDLNEAIRLDPNYAWAYARRGQAYRGLGQKDRAIQDLEKALSLDPNLDWAKQTLKVIRGHLRRKVMSIKNAIFKLLLLLVLLNNITLYSKGNDQPEWVVVPAQQQQKQKYYCKYCGSEFSIIIGFAHNQCLNHPLGKHGYNYELYEGSVKSSTPANTAALFTVI
jgi:tetratricopeptide (TPR) repeat protein